MCIALGVFKEDTWGESWVFSSLGNEPLTPQLKLSDKGQAERLMNECRND